MKNMFKPDWNNNILDPPIKRQFKKKKQKQHCAYHYCPMYCPMILNKVDHLPIIFPIITIYMIHMIQ
jgi:hypothetical protein